MNENVKPVLKWAGGKRQLLEEIIACIPDFSGTYYEPFVGGGAVWLNMLPKKAVINDYNSELIDLYQTIKASPDTLINLLEEHNDLYKDKGKEYYYFVRSWDRDIDKYLSLSTAEKVARTIFLNRTCFNGLFRVNRSGFFNTPIGRYTNPEIVGAENIRRLSKYLNSNKIKFSCGDFSRCIMGAQKNDFIYLDPPYYPTSATSSFTDYTLTGFGEGDQVRLKKICDRLNKRGILFLQSNSDCEFIRNLYSEYYIKKVSVRRAINSNKARRSNMHEVLIANYPIDSENGVDLGDHN